MIVNFAYPSAGDRTGGVMVLYELANGLSRLGVEVNFFHGPSWPNRIDDLALLPPECFAAEVAHHLIDDFDDPAVPAGDIVLWDNAPARLGLPATVVQGFRMLSEEWERTSFVRPGPKFCVAKWLIDIGLTFGVDPVQLIHTPNGIHHDVFSLTVPLDQRPIDVAVLFHPHRSKGWDVAVEALNELRVRRPDDRVVVFSRREPKQMPDGAEYIDSPEHPQLASDIYGQAKIFLQTSRFEGFGLTPLEAMACGATLVTTDCGGSRDYAIHDETAVVVASEQPRSVAAAVDALLDDTPRRLRLAAAGVTHAQTFRWDVPAAIMAETLERYVADPSAYQVPPGPEEDPPGELHTVVPTAERTL